MIDPRPQATRRNPEEMLKHLRDFKLDLRFSVGIWFFGDHASRFHAPLGKAATIQERLDTIASLADYGVTAVEAHYPNEVNEDNLDLYRQLARDKGVRLCTVIPNLFFEETWEFGSLSNPLPAVRQKAIERVKRSLELNKEMNTDYAIVWPGGDGYENPFGLDMMAARDRFASGLAEAMDAVPGVRVAIEPKPYEPRGRILYGMTGEGILLAQKVENLLKNPANRDLLGRGETLVGLNPEVGHVLMGTEDLPYAFSLILEYGRLYHTHWNSQPLGNYDQDLNVGVLSPELAEAALYVLKMHGYRGLFGIDINPERMPVEQAVKNSIDALRSYNDRINALDHEAVLACANRPDLNRGLLEALLIRARAVPGAKLPAMPAVRR
ncbi:MAG: TIM barrel protein [Bacteroidota bacterium]